MTEEQHAEIVGAFPFMEPNWLPTCELSLTAHRKECEALAMLKAMQPVGPVGHSYMLNGLMYCTIEKPLGECAIYTPTKD